MKDEKYTPGVTSGRLIPRVDLSAERIRAFEEAWKITFTSTPCPADHGRIATNVIGDTRERGTLLIRSYGSPYEWERVVFEVEALLFLAAHGLPVPTLLPVSTGGHILKEERGIASFAYPLIPGACYSQDELGVSLAGAAGALLHRYCAVAELFRPSGWHPNGDLVWIRGLLNDFSDRNPELVTEPWMTSMSELANDPELNRYLPMTPQGLVHADFFFENLLHVSDEISGLIDFGDAYYGAILNDIVIGAMEFSVLSDGIWDLELFRVFLEPHQGWLRTHGATPERFLKTLKSNCVRFAMYTLTSAEGMKFSENPYVARFGMLSDPDFSSRMKTCLVEG